MFESVCRTLRAARLSTFTYFALNGFVLGAWIVHIPAIEHRTGISHATLGWLLLLLGGGAFAAMQLVGPLADRLGARVVVPTSAALLSGALILPALAFNSWTLGAALLALGVGNGALDVSMNTHAVQVEAGYQRPIMSSFHAVFSVGGILAALLGARTLSWGWSTTTTLTMVSAAALVTTIAAAPALLPRAHAVDVRRSARRARRRTPGGVWALAGLAFILMLSEGVANDWSALAMRDVLHASPAIAALAYGAFATTMTMGRLLTDRLVARVGAVAIVRYGSALAAAALGVIMVSPSIACAIAGWALLGTGLSGVIPQLLSAAGHADRAAAGANVSRVAGLGYLGMLAGPASIGALTTVMPLADTFVLPLTACVIAALSASVVVPRRQIPVRDDRVHHERRES